MLPTPHASETPHTVSVCPPPEPRFSRVQELLFFFFTLVTGPRRSLSLKSSDTRVYAPEIRVQEHSRFRSTPPESAQVTRGFKAHRWLYHSTIGSRVIKKKKSLANKILSVLFFFFITLGLKLSDSSQSDLV